MERIVFQDCECKTSISHRREQLVGMCSRFCTFGREGKCIYLIFYSWIKWKRRQQNHSIWVCWFFNRPLNLLQMHTENRASQEGGLFNMTAIFTRSITALGQEATEINSCFLGLPSQEPQLPWINYLSSCHFWFLSSNKRKARFNKYWLSSHQVWVSGVETGRVVMYVKFCKEF